MNRNSDKQNRGNERFYRRYRGATITAAITGVVSFLAILTSDQYDGVASRLANGFGALLAFGGIAFGVAWLLTLAFRSAGGHIQRSSLVQPGVSSNDKLHRGLVQDDARRAAGIVPSVDASGDAAGIFVSYRRQDEPAFARLIFDRLKKHFGANRVFIDVESIRQVSSFPS